VSFEAQKGGGVKNIYSSYDYPVPGTILKMSNTAFKMAVHSVFE
jgi:hypothetical protein